MESLKNKLDLVEDININQESIHSVDGYNYLVEPSYSGILPIPDVDIYFEDNVWDFKETYLSKNGIFDFEEIHYGFRRYIKSIVLSEKLSGMKLTSLKKKFGNYKDMISFLEANYVYDCSTISRKDIEKLNEFILHKFDSENERIRNRNLFIKLLEKIEADKDIDYKELKEILESSNNIQLRKAQIQQGKTPNIDDKIFDNIISLAIQELDNKHLSDTQKIEACAILILSQTGMRISELSMLEANMIKVNKGPVPNSEVKCLKFYSPKILNWYNNVVMTDIGSLGYETLEKLTEKKRKKLNTNYLFTSNGRKPCGTGTVTNYLRRFIARNYMELGLYNKLFDGCFILTKKNNEERGIVNPLYLSNITYEDFISIPNAHQYRVAVCNKLVSQGVKLRWVMKHMGHLTEDMTEHYIRKEKEDNNEVLKGIIKKDFKLIGEEAEDLINRIEEFIEEGEYNIKTDLEQIVDTLSKRVPIRAKKNGFCIKSAFGKKCKYNEFICAFEACPNHCTSYIFADISYKRFKDNLKSIEYNEKNNFINEAKIEKKKLKRMAENYLIKELQEVKNEIINKGKEQLINENRNLEFVVNNIEELFEEVNKWIIMN